MAQKNSNTNPVTEVARMIATERVAPVTLTGGVKARLVPVPATLIDEVSSRISDPEVPMWHNDEKDRDEPNPSNPVYIKALAGVARQRGLAAIDAMCMFGVELIDPVPPKDKWLTKLQFLERKGEIDLSSYDLDDEMDVEFLWKRFIAVDAGLIQALTQLSAISPEEISTAEKSFRSN